MFRGGGGVPVSRGDGGIIFSRDSVLPWRCCRPDYLFREFHDCLKHLATSTCSNGVTFGNSGVTQAMPFQESTKSVLRTFVSES